MGILKHLLFWPVTGPQFLVEFSLGKVNDTVRENLTDDQAVKEELMALQMEVELGDIDDEEYMVREAALMQRLRDVRRWREEFGMGTSGGPVQVRQDEAAAAAAAADADEDPSVAESVLASPEGTDDRDEEEPRRGGIASSEGATVEFNLDWEE